MLANQFSSADRRMLAVLALALAAGVVFNLHKQNRRAVAPGFLLSVLEVPSSNFAAFPKENLPSAFAPLDLNRARREDLEHLPGVGPALAQRILDHRQKNGDFKTISELLRVPGIGPKKMAEIKGRVYISEHLGQGTLQRSGTFSPNPARDNASGFSKAGLP
jgi:competence ComEA-like helix-hairpin-helix protein